MFLQFYVFVILFLFLITSLSRKKWTQKMDNALILLHFELIHNGHKKLHFLLTKYGKHSKYYLTYSTKYLKMDTNYSIKWTQTLITV